jgi:hypothetical protein
MNDAKALKIDKDVGGIFGDEEKEFILPHSIEVEVHGVPSIHLEREVVLVIWDTKIIESQLKTISKEEDSKLHTKIDVQKLKKLVFSLAEKINGNDQITYRVIRGVDRVSRQFTNDEIQTTGREMTYIESQLVTLLFELRDKNILEDNLVEIREIFSLLKITEKSLISAPLTIESSREELKSLLGTIFNHG